MEEFRSSLAAEDLKKRYFAMATPRVILEEIEKKKREIQSRKVVL